MRRPEHDRHADGDPTVALGKLRTWDNQTFLFSARAPDWLTRAADSFPHPPLIYHHACCFALRLAEHADAGVRRGFVGYLCGVKRAFLGV